MSTSKTYGHYNVNVLFCEIASESMKFVTFEKGPIYTVLDTLAISCACAPNLDS